MTQVVDDVKVVDADTHLTEVHDLWTSRAPAEYVDRVPRVVPIDDQVLRRLCVEIYNDAMAEIQANSGNRLLPMPVLPAWDVDASVREARRVAGLGLRGVNMTSDTQDLGAPDLGDRAWDPLWEV